MWCSLSLLALGSSAPEIILALVEVIGDDFFAGELGPSTILGSASYNQLVIMAVCTAAVSSRHAKHIANLGVYMVTASLSIWAYIWLVVILKFSSPDIVEVWEAVVTLLFFPLLLVLSWMADRGFFTRKRDQGEVLPAQHESHITGMVNGAVTQTFDPWETQQLLTGCRVGMRFVVCALQSIFPSQPHV